jgi:hypothetical protein
MLCINQLEQGNGGSGMEVKKAGDVPSGTCGNKISSFNEMGIDQRAAKALMHEAQIVFPSLYMLPIWVVVVEQVQWYSLSFDGIFEQSVNLELAARLMVDFLVLARRVKAFCLGRKKDITVVVLNEDLDVVTIGVFIPCFQDADYGRFGQVDKFEQLENEVLGNGSFIGFDLVLVAPRKAQPSPCALGESFEEVGEFCVSELSQKIVFHKYLSLLTTMVQCVDYLLILLWQ